MLKVLISGSFEVPNVKGDDGVVGWEVLSDFPNAKVPLGWPNPEPDGPNVKPADGFGFSSDLLTKGLESVPKPKGESVFPLP